MCIDAVSRYPVDLCLNQQMIAGKGNTIRTTRPDRSDLYSLRKGPSAKACFSSVTCRPPLFLACIIRPSRVPAAYRYRGDSALFHLYPLSIKWTHLPPPSSFPFRARDGAIIASIFKVVALMKNSAKPVIQKDMPEKNDQAQKWRDAAC